MIEQDYLNAIVANDRCGFLQNVENWSNHRPLLLFALELTSSGKVLELGCGMGSTPYLHCFCGGNDRQLISFDNNKEWANKFKHLESDLHSIESKDIVTLPDSISVTLVDHAPGEQRWVDIQRLVDKSDILVIHDSEPEATGYMLDKIWHLFKYRLNIKTSDAWTTSVSNKYDLSKFNNLKLGEFLLES